MISDQLQKAVARVFEEYGDKIVKAAQAALEEKGKNASMDLSNSFSFKIERSDETVILQIYADEYLKYVEKGRGAGGMPPVQNLIKWIQYKGAKLEQPGIRVGHVNAKGVKSTPGLRRGKPALIRREVKISNEQFAYAIAKSIARRGQKGTPILEPVMEGIVQTVNEALLAAVKKSIQEDLRDIWKEGADTNLVTYKMNF